MGIREVLVPLSVVQRGVLPLVCVWVDAAALALGGEGREM